MVDANDKFTNSDIQAEIERQRIRYGRTYVDFDTSMRYFNVSRLPDYDNMAEPYISLLFMSRPSLNVATSAQADVLTGRANNQSDWDTSRPLKNYQAMLANGLTSTFTNDPQGKDMLMALSAYSPYGAWIPLVTNRSMNYSVGDAEIKTVEKGNTYFGHLIKYGKHSEDWKIGGNMSLDFRNDKNLSILKMMYLWAMYISLVSKNDQITPNTCYQAAGILDYAASVYYVVLRRNMRELVYWEKLTGVFPTRVPLSMFSNGNDSLFVEDKITIDFSYGMRSNPCDPDILFDINTLSGVSKYPLTQIMVRGPDYINQNIGRIITMKPDAGNFVAGDFLATYPVVYRVKNPSGGYKYHLAFVDANRAAEVVAQKRDNYKSR